MKIINKYFISSILFLLICLLLLIVSSFDYSWGEWRQATCMSTSIGCFCEEIGDGIIRQPINTWSSLAFVLSGFLVFSQANQDIWNRLNKNPLTANFNSALMFGSSLIIIGLGSAFYHASLTFAGQTVDVHGMYLLISYIIIYNYSRIYPIKDYQAILSFLFINALLAYFLINYPELRRYLFGVLLIFALLLELKYRNKKNIDIETKYIVWAVSIMVLSFIIWLLDAFKILCNPESIFQAHAIWHLGGSVAAWLLYLYNRSENSTTA